MVDSLFKIYFNNGSEKQPFLNLQTTGFLGYTGMRHRMALPEDDGMLFHFERPGNHAFWMDSVYIPLDMIFINEKLVIVHIEHNAKPEDTTPIYPNQDIKYCVEANGGWCEKNGVSVGNTVKLR